MSDFDKLKSLLEDPDLMRKMVEGAHVEVLSRPLDPATIAGEVGRIDGCRWVHWDGTLATQEELYKLDDCCICGKPVLYEEPHVEFTHWANHLMDDDTQYCHKGECWQHYLTSQLETPPQKQEEDMSTTILNFKTTAHVLCSRCRDYLDIRKEHVKLEFISDDPTSSVIFRFHPGTCWERMGGTKELVGYDELVKKYLAVRGKPESMQQEVDALLEEWDVVKK